MADNAEKYAEWLVNNKDKAGTPEFNTVAQAYKQLRQSAQPSENPIKAEVRKELGQMRKAGVPVDYGMSRSALQGSLFGAGDEIMAGLMTPFEMAKRGTINPAKAYEYAKARENLLMDKARKRNGLAGTVAEVAGGLGSGVGLARAGLTLMKPGAGMLSNVGRAAGEGAAYGGLVGGLEAEGAGRVGGAAAGAAIGGGLGGAIGAAPIVKGALGAPLSWLRATHNPDQFARRQLVRTALETDRTPTMIARDLHEAAQAGQPFTLADALGNPGQRLLSTVARAPGKGRTKAVEFLEKRQADQANRLGGILTENISGTRKTAQQAGEILSKARDVRADKAYDKARGSAGAVDVSDAIKMADKYIEPGVNAIVNPGSGIADDTIAGAVRRARSFLTDGKSVLTDFDKVLQRKKELDALIERASRSQKRVLIPIRNAVDDALAKASKPYAQARNAFRERSRVIDAIDTGKAMAGPNRPDDVARMFGAMNSNQQNAARIGFVDPKLRKIEMAAGPMTNRAREFTSLSSENLLPIMARPGRAGRLTRSLDRENVMHRTMAEAMGNSKTAENLADAGALGVDPTIIGNFLAGNYGTAARNLTTTASANLSGNTAAVREKLADALLSNADPRIAGMIARVAKQQRVSRERAARLVSGLLAGGSSGQGQFRK